MILKNFKFKKPWSYNKLAKNYTVNATFFHVQAFLTVAFFLALVSISFFGGGEPPVTPTP